MANEQLNKTANLLVRPQKDGAYKRVKPSETRFKAFSKIVEDKLGSLVILNLFIVLFCAPIIALIILRSFALVNSGLLYPFGGGIGVGYPAVPDLSGVAENLQLNTDLLFFAAFFACSFLAALGLSGGAYVIRNLVRTNGTIILKDFWKGLTKNYFPAMLASALPVLFLSFAVYVSNLLDSAVATGANLLFFPVVIKILVYLLFAFVVLVSFWIIALGVNYRTKGMDIITEAIQCTLRNFLLTLAYVALALAPVAFLFFGDFFTTLAVTFYILFGLCYALLVWFSYFQWEIDLFTTDGVVYEVEKTVGEKKTVVDERKEGQRVMALSKNYSYLDGRPMMSVKEGKEPQILETLRRDALEKCDASKAEMRKEADDYALAHENDMRYSDYNKVWKDREKALEPKKKTKGFAPSLLGK